MLNSLVAAAWQQPIMSKEGENPELADFEGQSKTMKELYNSTSGRFKETLCISGDSSGREVVFEVVFEAVFEAVATWQCERNTCARRLLLRQKKETL